MVSDPRLTETVVSKEIVYPGLIVNLEHWQVSLPNGNPATREVVTHPGAAAVAALDDQNRMIFVRQARPAVDRLTLEIPAGKLNGPDEDPLLCAQRELSEETGLTASVWRPLLCIETTPGFCNERIHLYSARGLQAGTLHPDEDEFVETVLLPLPQVLDLVMSGKIRDGKTVIAILLTAMAEGIHPQNG